MHLDNRISIDPYPAIEDRVVELTYNGILKESGADNCWIHYGFDGWKSPETKKMVKLPDGSFRTSISAEGSSEINYCFKDSAGHWDNNNGLDWRCDIEPAYM